jgi:hypothetical protein
MLKSSTPEPSPKSQNPLLSYVREKKYTVNVQCSVQYLYYYFICGNVFLCVIYRLNYIVFMYVNTNVMLYKAVGIIRGFL